MDLNLFFRDGSGSLHIKRAWREKQREAVARSWAASSVVKVFPLIQENLGSDTRTQVKKPEVAHTCNLSAGEVETGRFGG